MGAGPGATRFFFSKNSNTPLPAIIAARKASPFAEPVPARTSAGPGQMPASPQPTPNTRLPKMTRLSMRRALGSSTGAPSSVRVLFLISAKAPAPTATAPAMTSASEGSQAPAMSRKPSTFAGFAIPETRSPSPNTRPAAKEATVYMAWKTSGRDQVARDENGRESGSHERDGRRDRARRRPRDAAHAVAAGTASAVAGADSHQQSRCHQRGGTRVDPDLRQRGEDAPGERRGNQARDA